ncbi:ATP-binding protein [Streptomyces sp. HD]|uniref:ATP-binding protein n=1 Tax=Streptomyces sp. HD TaxID=3020892 RepID=UPI00232ADC1C|nr:ATP-binding protein [Streptomyces sp. HD]MDC0772861.1 ATP-binding protein [Streptomyces sp. HD]
MRMPETPQPLWTYGLTIPHDPRAVRVVRATIRSILAAAKLNCIVDTVELLASEVVTNAYRHSAMDAYVSLERTPDDFRVTVWDHGSGAPAPLTPVARDEHGRGLGIVNACADEWGVRDYPRGKAVWFSVVPKVNGDEA